MTFLFSKKKIKNEAFSTCQKRQSEEFWKFITSHSGQKLDWTSISANSNVTWDIINSHPEIEWDWYGLSCNPNTKWENFLENPDKE